MKILYISHKIPYPLSDGGRLRVFNHIKHLSKDNDITSLSFIQDKDELKDIEELKKYCNIKTITLPKYRSMINSAFGIFSKKPLRMWYLKDKKFKNLAKRLSKDADLIIIQALRMSQYSFYPIKTIIDIVDTPSLQIKRALKHESFIWKMIWKIELPRIIRSEKDIKKRFNNIIFASDPDKKVLGKGYVLKNGTKITDDKHINSHQIIHNNKNNIMFLGAMDYQPNIDAVKYFIKYIFPKIKKNIPDTKFYIVGRDPKYIKRYQCKDIIITGFVKDLKKFFTISKVFIAPLRIGSGIQNKILEAFNNNVPVITTSIVNKGIQAKDNKEIIVSDNPDKFAKDAIRLLNDDKLRKNISKNAKKFLKKNYSWKIINKKLNSIINKI